MILLLDIGAWARRYRLNPPHAAEIPLSAHVTHIDPPHHPRFSSRKIAAAMTVLIGLMFSKFFYLASLTAYYTFFLMGRFHISLQNAQLHLFIFLGAVAAGTIIGGPVGDRFGRKFVIWWSILGVLPFALMLPY